MRSDVIRCDIIVGILLLFSGGLILYGSLFTAPETTFLSFDTKIGRDAAIKVSPTELGPDWECRQPFHREVYKNHRDQMSSAEEMTRK